MKHLSQFHEYELVVSYLKLDGTLGKKIYTVSSFSEKDAREIVGRQFLKERKELING